MEGLINFCPLADYVAEISAPGAFVLVDIGVGGGIARQWRRLGRRLRAIGIDPSVREIERLTATERNPNVTYVNAFASLPPDHPFAKKTRFSGDGARNPWPRLSTSQYLERLYPASKHVEGYNRQAANLAPTVQLVSPEKSIVVPEFLRCNGIVGVDFLKIDVDGQDFEILNSFDGVFTHIGILGIGVEVNFFGPDRETANTFHNVDRYLKSQGFELFRLSTRHYSTAALPSRFVHREPAQTEFGRVVQGDAMYARDLASGLYDDFTASLRADRILNLLTIFAAFNLPDCAAEAALKFRSILSSICDVDKVLDLLTAQAQEKVFGRVDYQTYVSRFTKEPRYFLPARSPLAKAVEALKRGYSERQAKKQLRRFT